MQQKGSLSVLDKLLLAAYDLEQSGKRPFSAEDLVISAWRKFPDAFGMAGYHDETGQLAYPDSNRVFAEVMGSKPIRKRGLLVKVGTKMYQLTEAGREQVGLLQARSGQSSTHKAGLARDLEFEIKRLFRSKALDKFRNRRESDLTFYDACGFWGVSPRSSAIELQGRLANLEEIIHRAKEIVQDVQATFEHGGPSFGVNDLRTLLELHQFLLRRFSAEIAVIKQRTDERA